MYLPQAEHCRLALNTIMVELGKKSIFSGFEDLKEQQAACFVSLHSTRRGEEQLRGCIGTLEPIYESLYWEICFNAKAAAFSDPRFLPLRKGELDDITLSVDVLDLPEPITSPHQLDPAVYGVIVESSTKRGVLLPDLAGVNTIEKQLDIARSKAGISRDEQVHLSRFKVTRYH